MSVPTIGRSLLGADGYDRLTARLKPGQQAIVVAGDRVEIDLLDPAEGIAPGQAAVIYDGTRVVGSATIESTRRVEAHA